MLNTILIFVGFILVLAVAESISLAIIKARKQACCKPSPEHSAIQSIADRGAAEQMRRDCIQQVRNSWGAGEISQDAYESISGYIRNLE